MKAQKFALAGAIAVVLAGSDRAHAWPWSSAPEPNVVLDQQTLDSSSPLVAQLPKQRIRYEIKVDLPQPLDKYEGSESVSFVNLDTVPVTEVVFQLPPNGIPAGSSASGLTVSDATVGGKPVAVQQNGFVLTIPLAAPLGPGERTDVSLRFQGQVPHATGAVDTAGNPLQVFAELLGGDKQAGQYSVFSWQPNLVTFDHWYPIIPTSKNGVFDREVPSNIGDIADFPVADYSVEIKSPQGVKLVTTGLALSSEEAAPGYVKFGASAVREFTMVASPSLITSSKTVDNTVVNVHLLPGRESAAPELLRYAAQSLASFNKQFGKYPYRELDVVEAPLKGGAGGMEYAGLVTVASMMLDMDQLSSKLPSSLELTPGVAIDTKPILGGMLEFIVAHEVAHQWWHGLVGSNSKQEPFVDEALTNYSTLLYFEDVYGREAFEKQRYLQLEMNYQVYRLMGGKDRAVAGPASGFEGSLDYGAVVYGKGALMFDKIREKLGRDAFLAALSGYARANAFGESDASTLRAAFQTAASQKNPAVQTEMAALWDRWTTGIAADADIGVLDPVKLVEAFGAGQLFAGEDGAKIKQTLQLIHAIGALAAELDE